MNGKLKLFGAGGLVVILATVIPVVNGIRGWMHEYAESRLVQERDRMALEQRIMRLEMKVCNLSPGKKWWRGDCVEE